MEDIFIEPCEPLKWRVPTQEDLDKANEKGKPLMCFFWDNGDSLFAYDSLLEIEDEDCFISCSNIEINDSNYFENCVIAEHGNIFPLGITSEDIKKSEYKDARYR